MTQTIKSFSVTAAIIKKDDKFLIARRSPNKHLAGFWEFPGGKIEDGETPENCLKRELQEELNIQVTIKGFFMENEHHYGDRIIVLKAYLCELLTGEITLKDHDQFAWIDLDEFNNYNFAPADIPFIKALNAE